MAPVPTNAKRRDISAAVAAEICVTVIAMPRGTGLAEGRSVADQLVIQITGLIGVLRWSLVLSFVLAKAV